jgi:hypothetical protein
MAVWGRATGEAAVTETGRGALLSSDVVVGGRSKRGRNGREG